MASLIFDLLLVVCKFLMTAVCVTFGVFIVVALLSGITFPQQFVDDAAISSLSSPSMALGGGIPVEKSSVSSHMPQGTRGKGSSKTMIGGGSGHSHPAGRPFHDLSLEKLSEKPGAYLYAKLLREYNQNVLPVNNTRSSVAVRLLMRLTQIVDIDEKNQIMTTNVWLRHEWIDNNLKWDPFIYGGIETINIPADEIWLPDTILYNNADGDYQITIQTKVQVRYDGLVVWEPPAIYKSFCAIDVEFFPYDTQLCEMKFGPWTEDVSKVDYYLVNPQDPYGNVSNHQELAVDMADFYESVEWDVLKISGNRRIFKYPCCEEEYVDITYLFYIRRKTLFYTINLIIPCVAISFLTVLVFYLPCESGEKVALSISILISLTVFILLLSEIIPPTSLSLPLMGKYLLFTMILVTLSIAVTVLVLYNHFRHPYAYFMPQWVRYVFLDVLPKILMFHQSLPSEDDEFAKTVFDNKNSADHPPQYRRPSERSDIESTPFLFSVSADSGSAPSPMTEAKTWNHHHHSHQPHHDAGTQQHRRACFRDTKTAAARVRYGAIMAAHEEGRFLMEEALPAFDQYMLMPEVQDAMRCIHFISQRYRCGNIEARMKAEWEAVSRVLDRLFLMIFSAACLFGSAAILLHAPSLYDTTPPLQPNVQEEITVNYTNYYI